MDRCKYCGHYLVEVDTPTTKGYKCPEGCYESTGLKFAITEKALDFKIEKANVEVKTIALGWCLSDGGPISEEAKREIERLAELDT